MYKLEKRRRDHNKLQSPSFSSTLLDQIYRSIDEGQSKSSESKLHKEKTAAKTTTTSTKHWTDQKIDTNDHNKVRNKNFAVVKETNNRKFHHDHDPDVDVMFFSSTSISSDTSSGGFSSSDTDSTWPRPVRTSASFRWENEKPGTARNVQSFMHLAAQSEHGATRVRDEEALIKSKSRALKIYNNLKKMKQPVSPGGKLTSFLNSLFASREAKKKKKENNEIERRVNSGQASSTCCSASSFSRSCLSKVSSCDRENMSNGVKRTVRFYPAETEEEKNIVVEKAARDFMREYRYSNQKKKNDLVLKDLNLRKLVNYSQEHEDEDDDDDDDDAASYASSDLFELDHLGVLGNGMYDEELPVFETTHFSSNCAIANA